MVQYGDISVFYAVIPFFNIIYTYGMETAYFRFAAKSNDKNRLFQTSFSSLLVSTIFFSILLIALRQQIADFFEQGSHPEYIVLCVLILAFDTLSAIPFAVLRQEGRPRKYAFTRIAGITVNVLLTIFFIGYCPGVVSAHPDSAFAIWYARYTPVGFVLLANVVQNVITFLLLAREWGTYRFRFDAALWKKIFAYCWPMIIVGMGGMVNETLDRIMLLKLLPGTMEEQKTTVAIYSANYKIAIFITLFIMAFRMSAEPFFFREAENKNAPKTYARVMKWFVITLCGAFLFTALFADDLWKHLIAPKYQEGVGIVPILLAANIALGIYYNLSVWYKITDRMQFGMFITLVGAAITVVLNLFLIPVYGMYACAWATLAAYGSMMVLSYTLGQRYFPVPYPIGRLTGYITAMLALFFVQKGVLVFTDIIALRLLSGICLMALFGFLILRREREELKGMPVLGKYL